MAVQKITNSASRGVSFVRMPRQQLPFDFKPNNATVLCGKGKECYESTGNRRFRVIARIYLESYKLSTTKTEKSQVVNEVIKMVRGSGGGFVKVAPDGSYWEVGDAVAREKVGSHFRDCLHTKYRSAAKCKTARRRDLRQQSKARASRKLDNNGASSVVSMDGFSSNSDADETTASISDDSLVIPDLIEPESSPVLDDAMSSNYDDSAPHPITFKSDAVEMTNLARELSIGSANLFAELFHEV